MKNKWLKKIAALLTCTLLVGGTSVLHQVQQCDTSKAKNITQFFQNPQKNYNTNGQYKIGKVQIKTFESRCANESEISKGMPYYNKVSSGYANKDKIETGFGGILDERYLYAQTYLPAYTEYLNKCGYANPNIYAKGYVASWFKNKSGIGKIQDGYIFDNVYMNPYSEKRMQYKKNCLNSFSRIIATSWNKVSGATGYEIRLNQNYNGNWTGWTYRRVSANNVKIMGLQGGMDFVVSDYYLSGLDNRGLTGVKYKDNEVDQSLSIGCEYKLQVRAYKKVGSKYYYGNWSDTKTAKKINRTAYARVDIENGIAKITVPDVCVEKVAGGQNKPVEEYMSNPFALAHTGFEIQTSDSSNFVNAKTQKIKSSGKEITFENVVKGKYVRVRTYSNKKGVLPGEWSLCKKVK